jgi:hypothetical protein
MIDLSEEKDLLDVIWEFNDRQKTLDMLEAILYLLVHVAKTNDPQGDGRYIDLEKAILCVKLVRKIESEREYDDETEDEKK